MGVRVVFRERHTLKQIERHMPVIPGPDTEEPVIPRHHPASIERMPPDTGFKTRHPGDQFITEPLANWGNAYPAATDP